MQQGSLIQIASNKIEAATLDTTSINFTWQTWTFGGQAGSCTLNDVAIVSETDIWAVGEINIADTSINGYTRYNAVHWDGSDWILKRIPYYYQGQPYYNPIQTVFNFGANDVWFAGNGVIRWNGINYNPVPLPSNVWDQDQINKMWGISNNDLYIVGNTGSIAHYKNGQWSKIESGTDVDLLDIYGDNNGDNIFVAGYKNLNPTVLLKIHNSNVEKIIDSKDNLFNYRTDFISGAILSLWMSNTKLYVLTSHNFYITGFNTDGTAIAMWNGNLQDWDGVSIRGIGANDIVACGTIGKIWHYNGITWKTYNELINTNDRLKRIAIKGNICVATGYRYENGIQNQGLIYIGKR